MSAQKVAKLIAVVKLTKDAAEAENRRMKGVPGFSWLMGLRRFELLKRNSDGIFSIILSGHLFI